MILYLKKERELLKKFTWVQVRHIPRAENTWVDALAKLGKTPQEDLDRLIPVEHLPKPLVNIDDEEVSVPNNDQAEMDGPHLVLLGRRNLANRSKGGLQAQDEVG